MKLFLLIGTLCAISLQSFASSNEGHGGGSESALEFQLASVEDPVLRVGALSTKETLIKFFNEAREPLSILDLPEYAKVSALGFRCLATIATGQQALVYERTLNRINVNSQGNPPEHWGPLFPPKIPTWRVGDRTTSPFIDWKGVTFSSTRTEIVQIFPSNRTSFHSKIRLRKNNGLLTYNIVWDKSSNTPEVWGYCYYETPITAK